MPTNSKLVERGENDGFATQYRVTASYSSGMLLAPISNQ